MEFLIIFIVTFFAGLGAGLGTGFAGMSAAAVITPMLITFLGVDPYTAIGIALASDVLASGVSAFTYRKNKNLDVKNGLLMMSMILIFTVVGSYVSSIVPSQTMGGFSTFVTLMLGVKFILKPVMTTKAEMEAVSKKKKNCRLNSKRSIYWFYLRFCWCRRWNGLWLSPHSAPAAALPPGSQ